MSQLIEETVVYVLADKTLKWFVKTTSQTETLQVSLTSDPSTAQKYANIDEAHNELLSICESHSSFYFGQGATPAEEPVRLHLCSLLTAHNVKEVRFW